MTMPKVVWASPRIAKFGTFTAFGQLVLVSK